MIDEMSHMEIRSMYTFELSSQSDFEIGDQLMFGKIQSIFSRFMCLPKFPMMDPKSPSYKEGGL